MFDKNDQTGVLSYSTSTNDDGAACVFFIKAHGARDIKITFTELLMDSSDLVQYGSGSVAGTNLIGSVYSSTDPLVWISSTATAWIIFTINSSGNKKITFDYEIDVNDCNPNPCHNNGFCIDKYRSYECQCIASFTGANCETNSECSESPCLNGGTCFIFPGEPSSCYCLDGYHGFRCELQTGQNCGENTYFTAFPTHLVGNITAPSNGGGSYYCVYQLQVLQANSIKLIVLDFDDKATITIGKGETVGAEPQYTLSNTNTEDVYWINSTERVWITLTSTIENRGFWIEYEIDWDDCFFLNPCAHDGVCLDKYWDYECICVDGYEGKNCETASGLLCTNECSTNTIGVCNDGGAGSVDSFCQLGSDCYDCGPRGGKGVEVALVCTNTCLGKYSGYCADEGPGSTRTGCAYGTDCFDCSPRGQIVSQLCSDTCELFNNNGQCEDGGPITDDTPSSIGNTHCEIGTDCSDCGPRGPAENECKNNPCLNGGTCIFGEKLYECLCLPGWGGSHCKSQEELACNFETANADSCQWSNIQNGDEFDWSLSNGGTITSGTGPSSDHTYGNSLGNYQYIEASSPQTVGDRAFLVHDAFHASSVCLKFWYHIYGTSVGSLEIVVKTSSKTETIWMLSDNQGNSWQQGQIFLQYPIQYQVYFVGTVGSGDSGDIAIDDSIFYYSESSENCLSIPEHAAVLLPTQKTTIPTKLSTNEESNTESENVINIVIYAGIAGGVIVAVALIICVFCYRRRKGRRTRTNSRSINGSLPPPYHPGSTFDMNPNYISSNIDLGLYMNPAFNPSKDLPTYGSYNQPPNSNYQRLAQAQAPEPIYEEIRKEYKGETGFVEEAPYVTMR